MAIKEFKFELDEHILYKDKEMVIIGRGQFINQPNRYMLQDVMDYQKEGYRFDRGTWDVEKKLIKIKEK